MISACQLLTKAQTQGHKDGPAGFVFVLLYVGRLLTMKPRKEMLEEFLAQDPNDSFSRYALALELGKEGKEQEAAEQFREVIARDPDYVAAYHQLGRLLGQTGLIEEARDVYRRGLAAAIAAGDQRSRGEMQEELQTLE
jgi:tetratricopeptide (TPR) repeat protein